MNTRNSWHQKIREVLANSMIPMDVENVRLRTGLKNWESTKSLLLEMVLQGVISGQKTTKSWIFWVSSPGTGSDAQLEDHEVSWFGASHPQHLSRRRAWRR
jgi:hypothetical protein